MLDFAAKVAYFPGTLLQGSAGGSIFGLVWSVPTPGWVQAVPVSGLYRVKAGPEYGRIRVNSGVVLAVWDPGLARVYGGSFGVIGDLFLKRSCLFRE